MIKTWMSALVALQEIKKESIKYWQVDTPHGIHFVPSIGMPSGLVITWVESRIELDEDKLKGLSHFLYFVGVETQRRGGYSLVCMGRSLLVRRMTCGRSLILLGLTRVYYG